MGIDVFGNEGEKTEENPCRVLEPNQKAGHTSSNQAVVSHTKNRENKHREKNDETNDPLSL